MTELLSAAQMRAIEGAAIESGEVSGLELMERAGAGVVEAVFEEWPELGRGAHRAVVLCGPGNNGGDGFVVARLLKQAGWAVELFLYGDADKLPPDARTNYERWLKLGAAKDFSGASEFSQGAELFVDALFGTGLARPLSGALPDRLKRCMAAPDAAVKTVSVDIPSGLCSDSGRELAPPPGVIPADLTVTFHAAKPGHYLEQGPLKCGKIVIRDIGLGGGGPVPGAAVAARLVGPALAASLGKNAKAHKYAHGHAMILAGPSGRGGAARLAARGALRIGAGLVTVGCPAQALAQNAAQLNAVMLEPVHDGDALARVLKDRRINALCLGPGLGGERAWAMVPVALAAGRACVLDADALTAYAKNPGELFDLLHENCVLTPHAGEFARLFPDIAEKLNAVPASGPVYSRADATREAAARAGCVVLYKGPDTVIAAPDGRCAINSAAYERAAPWLATAGSGDVLAGFITGLLARGLAVMQAAETAAWLHVECALAFGPGLISEDLPEELPGVFSMLRV